MTVAVFLAGGVALTNASQDKLCEEASLVEGAAHDVLTNARQQRCTERPTTASSSGAAGGSTGDDDAQLAHLARGNDDLGDEDGVDEGLADGSLVAPDDDQTIPRPSPPRERSEFALGNGEVVTFSPTPLEGNDCVGVSRGYACMPSRECGFFTECSVDILKENLEDNRELCLAAYGSPRACRTTYERFQERAWAIFNGEPFLGDDEKLGPGLVPELVRGGVNTLAYVGATVALSPQLIGRAIDNDARYIEEHGVGDYLWQGVRQTPRTLLAIAGSPYTAARDVTDRCFNPDSAAAESCGRLGPGLVAAGVGGKLVASAVGAEVALTFGRTPPRLTTQSGHVAAGGGPLLVGQADDAARATTRFDGVERPARFGRRIPPANEAVQQLGHATRQSFRTGERIHVTVWNTYKHTRNGHFDDLDRLTGQSELFLGQEFLDGAPLRRALEADDGKAWTLGTSFEVPKAGTSTGVMTGGTVPPSSATILRSGAREPVVRTPKVALATRYPVEGGDDLLVVNVHAINFTTNGAFREHIAKVAQTVSEHPGPVIVAGDFNTWNRTRRRHLTTALAQHDISPVQLAGDARWVALDHIFTRGLTVENAALNRSIKSSDHAPIELDLVFDADPKSLN